MLGAKKSKKSRFLQKKLKKFIKAYKHWGFLCLKEQQKLSLLIIFDYTVLMNETRNTESQISTRGLDSEMEKKMEYTKETVQEAINTLNGNYIKMQLEAKNICDKMSYLHNKCEENTESYQNLFNRLNKLSDEREVNRIDALRLENYLKALV